MPGFDGTGPSGKGPMTGRSRGFCALRISEENLSKVKSFVGLQGMPVSDKVENFKDFEREVINMPFGNGTGPAGLGPMTGRAAGFCAGYSVPGYINPFMGRTGYYGFGVPMVRPYGIGSYGYYGLPYGSRAMPGFHRGLGFGRGFGRGRGRGRGRFGYWR
jgi:hypothetical protein